MLTPDFATGTAGAEEFVGIAVPCGDNDSGCVEVAFDVVDLDNVVRVPVACGNDECVEDPDVADDGENESDEGPDVGDDGAVVVGPGVVESGGGVEVADDGEFVDVSELIGDDSDVDSVELPGEATVVEDSPVDEGADDVDGSEVASDDDVGTSEVASDVVVDGSEGAADDVVEVSEGAADAVVESSVLDADVEPSDAVDAAGDDDVGSSVVDSVVEVGTVLMDTVTTLSVELGVCAGLEVDAVLVAGVVVRVLRFPPNPAPGPPCPLRP